MNPLTKNDLYNPKHKVVKKLHPKAKNLKIKIKEEPSLFRGVPVRNEKMVDYKKAQKELEEFRFAFREFTNKKLTYVHPHNEHPNRFTVRKKTGNTEFYSSQIDTLIKELQEYKKFLKEHNAV